MSNIIKVQILNAHISSNNELYVSVYLKSEGMMKSHRTTVSAPPNYSWNQEFSFICTNLTIDDLVIQVFEKDIIGDIQLCNHEERTSQFSYVSNKYVTVDLYKKKKKIGNLNIEVETKKNNDDNTQVPEKKLDKISPSNNKVYYKIKICEAQKLRKIAKNGICDPSVSIRLKSQDLEETEETEVAETTRDPVWNEEFQFISSCPRHDAFLISLQDNSEIGADLCDSISFPCSEITVDGPREVIKERLIFHGKPAGMLIFEVEGLSSIDDEPE